MKTDDTITLHPPPVTFRMTDLVETGLYAVLPPPEAVSKASDPRQKILGTRTVSI
jgi:hypothetical protein